MPVSIRRITLLCIALAAVAAVVLVRLPHAGSGGPAQAALADLTRGVEPEEAAYPKLGTAMRSRAWLIAAPGQPDGIDLFADLSDAQFGRERLVTPSDLRATLQRIHGLAWDQAAQTWTAGDRQVPIADVRTLLIAAMPTPTDAEAVIDLLLGTPSPGTPVFSGLLQAENPTLEAIHIVPFHGDRGRLLLDRGRPPYVAVERGYNGLLVSFSGAGWPAGWRVLRLRGIEP
jgi:hypothetical protein